jgi:hypothetical protein
MSTSRWRISVGACLILLIGLGTLPYAHADARHATFHQPVTKPGVCGAVVVGQAVAVTPGTGPVSKPPATPRPAKLTPSPTATRTSVPTPTPTGTQITAPASPTPTSTPAVVPFFTPTSQPVLPVTATFTPSPFPAPSLTLTPTPLVVVPPTAGSLPTATHTPLPNATSISTSTVGPGVTPTDTSLPTSTPLPIETATTLPSATPEPTATDTAIPVPSDTPEPTATDTAIPVPSDTPEPTATDTAIPVPSDTPVSTFTDTPTPTTSDTAVPTGTGTETPVETPTATPEVQPTPKPTRTPRPVMSVSGPGGAVVEWAGSPDSSQVGVKMVARATKRSISPSIVCVWTSEDSEGTPAWIFSPKTPVRLLAAWRVVPRAYLDQYRLHIHWDVYKGYQADVSLRPLARFRVAWREAPVPVTLEPGTFRLTFMPTIKRLGRGWYTVVAGTSLFGPGCPASGCRGTAREMRVYHY